MAETVSRKRPSLTSLCSAGAMDDNAQKLSGTSDLINVFDTLWCTTPLMKAMLDQDMNAFESLLNDDSVDVNEDIGGGDGSRNSSGATKDDSSREKIESFARSVSERAKSASFLE